MDRHSSQCAANFYESSPNSKGEYQIGAEDFSGSPSGTIGLPPHYSGWSMTSSTESKLLDNRFDASPLSTCSQNNLDTPLWNGDYNPFDTSFGKLSSFPNEASLLSVDYTSGSHQSWLTSPKSSSAQSYLGPRPRLCNESLLQDADLLFHEPAWRVETEIPVLSLPTKFIPSRKQETKVSKSTNKGITKEKRTKVKALRSRQDAPAWTTQSYQTVVAPDHQPTNVLDVEYVEGWSTKTTWSKEEDEKERHKYVEMKYRMQMKDRFEELLRALPKQNEPVNGNSCPKKLELDKKMTRGKVLGLAKEHIDSLDKKRRVLEEERDMLKYQVGLYETAWLSTGHDLLKG